MNLDINGKIVEVQDSPSRLLLWVLRDELGMVGTKYGCGAGICGSCTVHVEGVATRACITPLSAVAGKAVRTIEGLAEVKPNGEVKLHPVQQAWLDEQVPQCGWCQSGQMMQAASFLQQTPKPSEAQIVAAMSGNYCRCGCYVRIKQAVARAAQTQIAQTDEVKA